MMSTLCNPTYKALIFQLFLQLGKQPLLSSTPELVKWLNKSKSESELLVKRGVMRGQQNFMNLICVPLVYFGCVTKSNTNIQQSNCTYCNSCQRKPWDRGLFCFCWCFFYCPLLKVTVNWILSVRPWLITKYHFDDDLSLWFACIVEVFLEQ